MRDVPLILEMLSSNKRDCTLGFTYSLSEIVNKLLRFFIVIF